MSKQNQKNVFGEPLEPCSNDPLTGWLRDGCCNTDKNDRGVHTVCAKVNDEFLQWSRKVGNDLITPHPEFGFPGLKDGDSWCVCASWYAKAIEEGAACQVYLKKTNVKTLDLTVSILNPFSTLNFLIKFKAFILLSTEITLLAPLEQNS